MFRSLRWWSRPLLAAQEMCGPGPACPVLALALMPALGVAPAVHADAVRVTPRIVVVEQDSTPMRCAAGMPFYAVNTLEAGQTLRVDAEEDGWLRVEYLTGMLAFVKAEDAALAPDGESIRLTRPSRLAAVNGRGNERGHWWFLLDTPLPADSSLRVQQTLKAMNEVTTGYLVVAPARSRGYVKADSVRNATDDEASAFQERTDLPAPASAAAAPERDGPLAASPDALGAAEVIHDLPTLKARYAEVMALKGDEARERIPVVITEFEHAAAALGSSSEDAQLRRAFDWSISALRLRHEVLSTLKAYSREETIASRAPTHE